MGSKWALLDKIHLGRLHFGLLASWCRDYFGKRRPATRRQEAPPRIAFNESLQWGRLLRASPHASLVNAAPVPLRVSFVQPSRTSRGRVFGPQRLGGPGFFFSFLGVLGGRALSLQGSGDRGRMHARQSH